jgi:hypothetical protein
MPGLKTYTSFEDFQNRLKRPLNGVSIAILAVGTETELARLETLRPYLEGARIILVLPEENETVLPGALDLYPSFIAYLHEDPNILLDVLEKMQHRQNRKPLVG